LAVAVVRIEMSGVAIQQRGHSTGCDRFFKIPAIFQMWIDRIVLRTVEKQGLR
jgi:hypothetical protein